MKKIFITIGLTILYLVLSAGAIILTVTESEVFCLLFILISVGYWLLLRPIFKEIPSKIFVLHFILNLIGVIALASIDFFMFLMYIFGAMEAECNGGHNPNWYIALIAPIINILYVVGLVKFYKKKKNNEDAD